MTQSPDLGKGGSRRTRSGTENQPHPEPALTLRCKANWWDWQAGKLILENTDQAVAPCLAEASAGNDTVFSRMCKASGRQRAVTPSSSIPAYHHGCPTLFLGMDMSLGRVSQQR